jgi:hypothetical protein
MATTPAPHAHQVKVRDTATGQVFLAWPVDARELVTHPKSQYEYAVSDTPLGSPDAPPALAVPSTPASTTQLLEAKSYKELQALARRAHLNANQKQADLIAELTVHVDAGTISLATVPKLAIDPVQFPNAAEG